MVASSSIGKTTPTNAWWLDEDEKTRRAIVLLRVFESTTKKKISGLRAVPPAELLSSPKFATARTITKWLEDRGYQITLNRSHWQGYIKFALKQMPCLFFAQLMNPMLFERYCSQASFRLPRPPAKRDATQLSNLYGRVLRRELTDLASLQVLGISQTRLEEAVR